MKVVMGRAKEYWRELVPIIARTHPAFREPYRSAEGAPGHDDLESEIRGLRREVRELSEELRRQRKVLAGVVAQVGGDGPAARNPDVP